MRSLVLVLTFLLASPAIAQNNVIELRNADVLSMIEAKVPTETIITKIQTSRCNFDTFPTVISELRYRGVPEEILIAMMEAPVGRPTKTLQKQPATQTKTTATPDPPEKLTKDAEGLTDEAGSTASGKVKVAPYGSAEKISTESVKLDQKTTVPIKQTSTDVTEQREKPTEKSTAVEQKILTNDDILKLLRGGLATGDVAAAIKNARGNYDFSGQALHALQEAGADGLVFLAMMEASRRPGDLDKKSDDTKPKP
jgi:hypothetical protein